MKLINYENKACLLLFILISSNLLTFTQSTMCKSRMYNNRNNATTKIDFFGSITEAVGCAVREVSSGIDSVGDALKKGAKEVEGAYDKGREALGKTYDEVTDWAGNQFTRLKGYDQIAQAPINTVVKIMWSKILSKGNKFDSYVDSFDKILNNPATELLKKLKKLYVDKKFKWAKADDKKIEVHPDVEVCRPQTTFEKLKTNVTKMGLQYATDFANKHVTQVFNGFFEEMLYQFTPVGIMLSTDVTKKIKQVQEDVVHNTNSKFHAKGDWEKQTKAFITKTVEVCVADSNIKGWVNTSFKVVLLSIQTGYESFQRILCYLNQLLNRGQTTPCVAITNIVHDLQEYIADIWAGIKTVISELFTSLASCYKKTMANFRTLQAQVTANLFVTVTGGLMDGLINTIPFVSQLRGSLNSLIALYNHWRLGDFGEGEANNENKDKKDVSSTVTFGRNIAKFIGSIFKAVLGLFNQQQWIDVYKVVLASTASQIDNINKLKLAYDDPLEKYTEFNVTLEELDDLIKKMKSKSRKRNQFVFTKVGGNAKVNSNVKPVVKKPSGKLLPATKAKIVRAVKKIGAMAKKNL